MKPQKVILSMLVIAGGALIASNWAGETAYAIGVVLELGVVAMAAKKERY